MFKLLIFFTILGLVFGGASDPEGKTTDEHWMSYHNTFVENTRSNGKNITVLFYGDSITQGWLGAGKEIYNKYYVPLGVANYGIGGDQTQNLLWRIENEEVDGLSPKVCVLKIGTNNLQFSEEEVIDGIHAIVKLLRKKLPNTKVLLLGILPRHNLEATFRMDRINAVIASYDDGKSVRFLNMRNVFAESDGRLNNELYSDGLHLSYEGYKAWAETMNPLFTEMLSP